MAIKDIHTLKDLQALGDDYITLDALTTACELYKTLYKNKKLESKLEGILEVVVSKLMNQVGFMDTVAHQFVTIKDGDVYELNLKDAFTIIGQEKEFEKMSPKL